MADIDIIKIIEELKEWEALMEEAKAQADSLRDILKLEMNSRGVEELNTSRYTVHWTSVLSSRLDTTAMKKSMPDVYKLFQKQVTSRRFTISG